MSSQNTNKLSQFHSDEFNVKVKKDYHEALDRSGHAVPCLKAAGVTVDYLTKVELKQVWCPMYDDIKIRSCYNPPKKEVFFNEIVTHLSQHGGLSFGLADSSKVPADWLVKCLSTLNPDH